MEELYHRRFFRVSVEQFEALSQLRRRLICDTYVVLSYVVLKNRCLNSFCLVDEALILNLSAVVVG